jgi:hypothetical protein
MEDRFILTHSFMVADPLAFGPVVKQSIMVVAHSSRNLFTSWQQGSKERIKDQGPNIPFLPLGPSPKGFTTF